MNLKKSFPQKDEKELLKIEKDFYKHLSDLFVEIIKGLSISSNEIKKRMVYENPEIFHDYLQRNQSCVVVLTH